MKAVLILDMPTNCIECLAQFGGMCYASNREVANTVSDLIKKGGKPDWCPLKPMPQRRLATTEDETDFYLKEGWNACIEELEK